MLHRAIIADPVMAALTEPDGLSEWRIADAIDTYLRGLRVQRSWARGKVRQPEREILRGALNAILFAHGFRVTSIPRAV